MVIPADPNDKGYRIVELQSFGLDVLEKLQELGDLYDMTPDLVIIIARHYNWDDSKMQQWFSETDGFKYELGVEFDEKLPATYPEMNASLPS